MSLNGFRGETNPGNQACPQTTTRNLRIAFAAGNWYDFEVHFPPNEADVTDDSKPRVPGLGPRQSPQNSPANPYITVADICEN